MVLVAIALIYSNSLENAFQYDDIHSIVENEHIRSIGNVPRFFVDSKLFSVDPKGAMYRPLVLTSYLFNYRVGEYAVQAYHVFNLALHIFNTFLVALLVRVVSGSRCQSLIAAVYFGFVPTNSEVVNYISSRSESLCALFFLLAAISYIKMAESGNASARWTISSLIAFGGALFSKSVGMTFLGVIVWYEICRSRFDLQGAARRIFRYQKLFWSVGLLYLIGYSPLISGAILGNAVRSMSAQFLTQAKALVYYLKLLLVPVDLNVEHQFFIADGLFKPGVAGSLALLASVAAALWLMRSKFGSALLWLGWAAIVLLPTIVIPLNVLVNEHRLYLASVAGAALFASLLERLIDRNKVLWISVAIVAIAFADLSHARNRVWRTTETLWDDSFQKAPLMPRPHIYRADHLKKAGDTEGALEQYTKALNVHPEMLSQGDRVVIHNNIGATYLAMGRFLDAVDAYQRALAIDPEYKKSKEALEGVLSITAEDRDHESEEAHKRGLRFLVKGQIPEAIESFKMSLSFQNAPDAWLALGMAYERANRWEEAQDAYEALKLVGKETRFSKTAEAQLAQIQIRLSSKD